MSSYSILDYPKSFTIALKMTMELINLRKWRGHLATWHPKLVWESLTTKPAIRILLPLCFGKWWPAKNPSQNTICDFCENVSGLEITDDRPWMICGPYLSSFCSNAAGTTICLNATVLLVLQPFCARNVYASVMETNQVWSTSVVDRRLSFVHRKRMELLDSGDPSVLEGLAWPDSKKKEDCLMNGCLIILFHWMEEYVLTDTDTEEDEALSIVYGMFWRLLLCPLLVNRIHKIESLATRLC